MTGKEAKELIIRNATPYFEERGWHLKKVQRNEAVFIRKENDFSNRIGISTLDYNPIQVIDFGLGKYIDSIENIMRKINQNTELNPPLDKDCLTLYLTDKDKSNLKQKMSECRVEQHIINSLNPIFDYLNHHALPTLEKFNDLREIDKLINGEANNYWETDWHKPFNLAGYFYLRRLIIAKLSGRKDYTEFIEKEIEEIEREAVEANETFDRNDLSDELAYCIHLLKDVDPLY